MTPAEDYYNWSQAISMGKLVSQISRPITFPIRAVLVKRSWEQIHWLLDLSETFTITIWSSLSDKVDVQDLVRLRGSVKKSLLRSSTKPREGVQSSFKIPWD